MLVKKKVILTILSLWLLNSLGNTGKEEISMYQRQECPLSGDKLKSQIPNAKRLLCGGRKSNILKYEKNILLWIIDNRKLGISISIKSIIAYLYYNYEETRNEKFNNLYMDIIRLLKRKGLSIRLATNVGQALPYNAIESFYRFFHLIIKERRELNIDDREEFRIINCDETPIYFEMPDTTTIDIKGNKEVIINTKGNEKKRISVLLNIVGDGSKLPAVLIFKGKKGKIIEKEIKGNIHVLRKEIFALVQENSWCYSQIFSFWYENIFLNYEKKINKKCILILDKAPSYIDNDILEKFKLNQTHYVYIPAGLTRYV